MGLEIEEGEKESFFFVSGKRVPNSLQFNGTIFDFLDRTGSREVRQFSQTISEQLSVPGFQQPGARIPLPKRDGRLSGGKISQTPAAMTVPMVATTDFSSRTHSPAGESPARLPKRASLRCHLFPESRPSRRYSTTPGKRPMLTPAPCRPGRAGGRQSPSRPNVIAAGR